MITDNIARRFEAIADRKAAPETDLDHLFYNAYNAALLGKSVFEASYEVNNFYDLEELELATFMLGHHAGFYQWVELTQIMGEQ